MHRILRFERHEHGPRTYVCGRRIHEWHAGLVGLAIAAVMSIAGTGGIPVALVAAVSAWLVIKDWRDLHPATRGTATWSLGVHRVIGAPRPTFAARLPLVAGIATMLVGAVNVVSAALPDMADRLHLLLGLAPIAEVTVAHHLGLPLGLSVVAAGWQLARGRRGAVHVAVGVLAVLGVVDVARGLDVEEAAITWVLAFGLWRARQAFPVKAPSAVEMPAVTLLSAGVLAVCAPLVVDTGMLRTDVLVATGAVLLTLGFGRLLRPAHPFAPCGSTRNVAAEILRGHGGDTLSAFKLRQDLHRCFSDDGRAFTGRRVQAGALLVAGDPVGPADAVRDALAQALHDARVHGLPFGVVGASEHCAEEGRALGLRSMYLGDEAMIATGEMDLSGGANKSLRKAVNRVAREGFTAEVHQVGDLDPDTLHQLEVVSERWRDGEPERGFSMAHDELVDDLLGDALVVLGRDGDGVVRGFLHFAPVFGRPIASLGFMRRDPETPNGLMDFLVVESARLLGERGLEEFSLNFAAFGRWLRDPSNFVERWLAKLLRVGDRWFQVERLHRYNAKFHPRWQPRFLLYEGPRAWPRIAVAAMAAEGQLPLPTFA